MYVNVIAVFHCFQSGVTPPLMCFWCCCVMHACACVSDFTSSTLRCLAGEVNTMEKMTRSTRCLWNGARHGHRHMRNKNTNAQEKDRTHTHTQKDKHLRVQNKKTTRTHPAKMMECEAPVNIYLCLRRPFLLAGLALTLPERLDLMTCWERDGDTWVGGKKGGRKGRKDGIRRGRGKKWMEGIFGRGDGWEVTERVKRTRTQTAERRVEE